MKKTVNGRFMVMDGGRNFTKGPIHERTERIKCKKCGNIDKFTGYVIHSPMEVDIYQIQDEPGKYDITEVRYTSNENTIERAAHCGICGSKNLEFIKL